ncbi:MAG: hypothetical protein PHR47_02160 [Candidatus Pacebacteria bacterium]|nr:hypothetical protein [Candidatus Paceibacterota bacterium]
MAEEFLKSISRNKEASIPPDFDVGKARRVLTKTYHPDVANGKDRKENEEKMKKINIAFDKKDVVFLYGELEKLRIAKEITEEQEEKLRKEICNIEEIYETSEEFEETLEKVRKGKYREAVDDVIAKAKEKGIFYTVKILDASAENQKIKMIPYKKQYNKQSDVISDKKDTANYETDKRSKQNERENDNTVSSVESRLRDIQRMMNEINRLNKPENDRDERKEVNEITNLDEGVNIVSFGKKKEEAITSEEKNSEILHRNLKEWSSSEIKDDPCSFIGDVLNNITLQLKRKKELRLPNRALGIVFQLLQREYSKAEYDDFERNKNILDEARKNLLGNDVDKIISELKNAESLFRIDNIFKEYIKDNKIFNNKERKEDEIAPKEIEDKKETILQREDSLRDIVEETRKKKEAIRELIESQQDKIPIASTENAKKSIQEKPFQAYEQKPSNKKPDIVKDNAVFETKKPIDSELFEKTKKDVIEKISDLNDIVLPGEGISKRDMADYSSKFNVEDSTGKTTAKKPKEEILTKEKPEENHKIYFEMVQNLVDLDMKAEDIKRKRIKQESISVRWGIKESKESELANEYKKTQSNYRKLREEFMKKSGLKEEEVDEKIISMRQELEQRRSRFNKEKAEEYIQHLKKIVEYQKDSLPEKKKAVFEKMATIIKDKKFQIIVSALILGISITVPETGGASWLTHGLVSGFLPAELGLPLKYAGTATGGYLFGDALKSILQTRKLKITEVEKKIVEKISNFVYPKVNSINDFSIDDDYVIKSATFFDKFKKLEIKSNFIETKRQIRES